MGKVVGATEKKSREAGRVCGAKRKGYPQASLGDEEPKNPGSP